MIIISGALQSETTEIRNRVHNSRFSDVSLEYREDPGAAWKTNLPGAHRVSTRLSAGNPYWSSRQRSVRYFREKTAANRKEKKTTFDITKPAVSYPVRGTILLRFFFFSPFFFLFVVVTGSTQRRVRRRSVWVKPSASRRAWDTARAGVTNSIAPRDPNARKFHAINTARKRITRVIIPSYYREVKEKKKKNNT